jgi:hypothetical protein
VVCAILAAMDADHCNVAELFQQAIDRVSGI